MKTSLLTIILIISSVNSFAQDLVKLSQGSEAPFSGVLITNDRLNQFRITDEKYNLERKQNIELKALRLTDKELSDYYKAQSSSYKKMLVEAKFESHMTNVGYFVLGVLVTGFAFKVSEKINDL